jgi:excisionase family DNA binding protein
MRVPGRRHFFRAAAAGRAPGPSRDSNLARKNRERSNKYRLLAWFPRASKGRKSPEISRLRFEAVKDTVPLLTAALVSIVDPAAGQATWWAGVVAIATLYIIRIRVYRNQVSRLGHDAEPSGKGNGERDDPAATVTARPVSAELLTVEEVAKALRVSKKTVYRIISRKELEAIHIGRSIRVRRDVLDKYTDGVSRP